MFSLFFNPQQPTNAQLDTLYILSKKVYVNLYGHTPKEAAKMAERSVCKWIDRGLTHKALKMLWKGKIS